MREGGRRSEGALLFCPSSASGSRQKLGVNVVEEVHQSVYGFCGIKPIRKCTSPPGIYNPWPDRGRCYREMVWGSGLLLRCSCKLWRWKNTGQVVKGWRWELWELCVRSCSITEEIRFGPSPVQCPALVSCNVSYILPSKLGLRHIIPSCPGSPVRFFLCVCQFLWFS